MPPERTRIAGDGPPISPPSDPDEPMAGMLDRLRKGDSQAVAQFLTEYGPVVRAHFRRKIGPGMQRLVDSQDLLSTILRRLCQRVGGAGIRAENHRQFWALVYRIGNDALVDRIQVVSRLREMQTQGSDFARFMAERLVSSGPQAEHEFTEQLALILERIESSVDRELLVLWLHGRSLSDAGEALGLSPAGARKRWQRLRETIRASLEGSGG